MPAVTIALLLLALLPLPALAEEVQYSYSGSVSSRVGYDTNAFFDDEGSAFLGVSAGLDLTRQTENTSLSTGMSVGSRYFFARNEFTYDLSVGSVSAGLTGESAAASTDTGGLGLSYTYRFTDQFSSTTSVSANLQDAFGYNLSETGVTTPDRESEAYDFSVSQGFSYAVTPRDTLGASYSFRPLIYRDDDLADSYTHTGSLSYSRLLTERLTGSLSGSYSNTRFSETTATGTVFVPFRLPDGRLVGTVQQGSVSNPARTQETWSPSVGLSYEVTERLSLSSSLGVSFTTNDFGEDDGDTTRSITGAFSASYVATERLNLRAGYDRSVSQSVFQENILVDGVDVGFGYRLLEFLDWSGNGSFRRSATLREDREEVGTSYSAGTGFSYRLAEFWTADLDYGYTYSTRGSGSAILEQDLGLVPLADEVNQGHSISMGVTWRFGAPLRLPEL